MTSMKIQLDLADKLVLGDVFKGEKYEFIINSCIDAPYLLEACKYTIEQAGLSINSPSYKKLIKAVAIAEGK